MTERTGWICPRCNRVNSPGLRYCDCGSHDPTPLVTDPLPGTTPARLPEPLPHERPQVWCAGQDLEHYSTRGKP